MELDDYAEYISGLKEVITKQLGDIHNIISQLKKDTDKALEQLEEVKAHAKNLP